jgi:hypothetical protein
VSKIKILLTKNLQGVVEQKRLLNIVYLAGVLSRISGLYIPNKKHIGIFKNLMMACIYNVRKTIFFSDVKNVY